MLIKYKGEKMAKRLNLADWLLWIVSISVSLGIAGLFFNGILLSVPLLSIFPLVFHQVIAWVIYAGIVIDALKKFKVL